MSRSWRDWESSVGRGVSPNPRRSGVSWTLRVISFRSPLQTPQKTIELSIFLEPVGRSLKPTASSPWAPGSSPKKCTKNTCIMPFSDPKRANSCFWFMVISILDCFESGFNMMLQWPSCGSWMVNPCCFLGVCSREFHEASLLTNWDSSSKQAASQSPPNRASRENEDQKSQATCTSQSFNEAFGYSNPPKKAHAHPPPQQKKEKAGLSD